MAMGGQELGLKINIKAGYFLLEKFSTFHLNSYTKDWCSDSLSSQSFKAFSRVQSAQNALKEMSGVRSCERKQG